MGGSLARLLADLELLDDAARDALPRARAGHAAGGVSRWPRAASRCRADAALTAYVWSWLENQVLAAMKPVPLGQVAGQRMLLALGARHPGGRRRARSRSPTTTSRSFAPGLALASARHETQYTRLFRS